MTEHEARETPPSGKFDITVPHSARIWNYWLGGKDNYTVDREAGDAFREIYPDITVAARAVRAFLARAVSHLAGEADIRQFLATSGPGCRPPTTPTRSPSGSRPRPGSCTWTTTRWSWCTRGRC